ncbi:Uncharacterized protein GBIM_17713 [Gryllus bimaculatus]|nr:Uncharacterized protein GBIM_17713 [Gryllus bimaculatus]
MTFRKAGNLKKEATKDNEINLAVCSTVAHAWLHGLELKASFLCNTLNVRRYKSTLKCSVSDTSFSGVTQSIPVKSFTVCLSSNEDTARPHLRVMVKPPWRTAYVLIVNIREEILNELSVLLVFRLALLQGSLPRFSNQDNPAAFHPSRLVR